MEKRFVVVLLFALLLGTGLVFAAKPVRNIKAQKHPNLAAAQSLVQKAYERVQKAQRANEFDLQGHAQKAKDLLEQAHAELKLAAVAANQNTQPAGK